MSRPVEYDAALRQSLIEEAARRIAEAGVPGLALRPLATAVGTSTNAVYTLFGSKDALVEAVVDEARASLFSAQDSVPHTDDTLVDLIGLGYAYRDWALANPELYEVLMAGMAGRAGQQDRAGWTDDMTVQPLLAGVRRAIEAGTLDADDADTVCVTLWAGVHGLVGLEMSTWKHLPRAERDARFADYLLTLPWRWLVHRR